MVWFNLFHAFFGEKTILIMLKSMLVLLFEAWKSLKPAIVNQSKIPRHHFDKNKNWQQNLTKPLNFRSAVRVYRKSYLIWEAFMQIGYILYPAIILAAFLQNVVTTFFCLGLYKELPLLVIIMLFCIDVIVFGNTVVFHAYALVICNDFEQFYRLWKPELKGKRSRMILKFAYQSE